MSRDMTEGCQSQGRNTYRGSALAQSCPANVRIPGKEFMSHKGEWLARAHTYNHPRRLRQEDYEL